MNKLTKGTSREVVQCAATVVSMQWGMLMFIAAMLIARTSLAAQQIITILAPNGVGDVTTLTNELTRLANIPDSDLRFYPNTQIWLTQGVYDLRGVYMSETSHLRVRGLQGFQIAGLGDKPEDTVLLGGGEAEGHRVLELGYANKFWNVVSNLTVTGGYTSGSGGGISSDPNHPSTLVVDCIISNNVANASNRYAGGGGVYNGCARRTLFANNSTGNAGGGIHCGKYVSDVGVKPYCDSCTFIDNKQTANYGSQFGGASASCAVCSNCTFYGNSGALYGGALGISIYGSSSAYGCTFTGEYKSNYAAVAYRAYLEDCVISNATTTHPKMFLECDMMRCTVRDCTVSNTANGYNLDTSDTAGVHTNVNCLFVGNYINTYGAICNNKVLVNCTIVSNRVSKSNWARVISSCAMYNCALTGNKVDTYFYDIRKNYNGGSEILNCANCVFSAADVDEDAEGLTNCRKVANLRFADERNGDYTPTCKSPLYDTGLRDNWLVSLVGMLDRAGRARVFGKGIDIGAYECQIYPPGFILSFR